MLTQRSRYNFFGSLLLAYLLALLGAIAFGAASTPIIDTFSALINISDSHEQTSVIIQKIRLPRALLAGLTGATLAMCGAVSQGLFRNPLADPSLIGVSAGASLGASLVIFFTMNIAQIAGENANLPLVAVGAFIGGIISVFFVYRLATNEFGTSVPVMLLVGIAVTALASSCTSLLEYFSDNETLRRISLWRMGGLDGADYSRCTIAGIVFVGCWLALRNQAQALNVLLLGESEARHLGIELKQLKRRLIVIIAAGVGISVALSGTISFLGLIVPHLMRLILGPNHRYLLPASALFGALLLTLADIVARLLIAPTELPVGLVTAFLGAPFFIYLLCKRKNLGVSV